jgi:hypothetical protein
MSSTWKQHSMAASPLLWYQAGVVSHKPTNIVHPSHVPSTEWMLLDGSLTDMQSQSNVIFELTTEDVKSEDLWKTSILMTVA